MNETIGRLRRPATIGLLAAAAVTLAPMSGALAQVSQPKPSAADIQLTYDPPEVASNNEGITWRWTLTNAGPAGADKIVVTHRLEPTQKVKSVSEPCKVQSDAITCSFTALKAGETKRGKIESEIGGKAGTFTVNGRVTWREAVVESPKPSNTGSTGSTGSPGPTGSTGKPANTPSKPADDSSE